MKRISLPLPARDLETAAAAAASMRAQHRGTEVTIDGAVATLASDRLDAEALRSAWCAVLLTERLVARSADHRSKVRSGLLA